MTKYVRLLTSMLIIGFVGACDDQTGSTNSRHLTESRSGSASSQPFSQLLVYPKKNPIGAFELLSHKNERFDQSGFKGSWNLLFMGYTHCPDVCPMTLTDMTQIYQGLSEQAQKNLNVVFLSVDPERDTPEHIAGYVSHFHDDIVGLTGDKTQIDKLVGELGGIYSLNSEDPEYYTVDHTARIFIIDPHGRRYGIVKSEAMHNKDKSELVKELIEMATS